MKIINTTMLVLTIAVSLGFLLYVHQLGERTKALSTIAYDEETELFWLWGDEQRIEPPELPYRPLIKERPDETLLSQVGR